MADIKIAQGEVNGEKGLVAGERLYETKDGRVVGEGDPDAVSLVAGAGSLIDARTAQRLRLSEKGQAEGPAEGSEPVPSTITEAPPGEVVRPLNVGVPREAQATQPAPQPAPQPEEKPEPEPSKAAKGK